MIIYTYQKSKKRKPNAKAKALKASWDAILKKYDVNTVKNKKASPVPVDKPYRRETPYYPSLKTDLGNTCKPKDKVYTGTAMLGIGTLHKSNAVPVFSKEDAEEQAKMRR